MKVADLTVTPQTFRRPGDEIPFKNVKLELGESGKKLHGTNDLGESVVLEEGDALIEVNGLRRH